MYLHVLSKKTFINRAWAFVIISCVLVSSGISAEEEKGILMDGVAAHVNEHVVRVSEVLAIVAQEHRRLATQFQGLELKRRLEESYMQMLNVVVERYLVLDAYAEQEVKLPEWVVDRRIEDIVTSSFGDDKSKLMETLAADGVTFEEWRKDMLDRIIVSTMNNANVSDNIRVAPSMAKAEYDKSAAKYARPEEVLLRLIVQDRSSSGEAMKTMKDLVKKLESGKKFDGLAKEFSSGSKASAGGLWDWIEPKMLRPELLNAVKSMKKGEVSGVIEAKTQLYILKLEDRKDSGALPFAEVQSKIERSLRARQAEHLYVAWMERLKESAYVKLFDVELF